MSAKAPGGPARVLAFSAHGAGGWEEERLRALLERLSPDFFAFDRGHKLATFFRLLGRIRRERPDLVVMEGTGIAGGLALLLGRLLARVPYVVSSGDAIGPFVAAHSRLLGPVFALYERVLCKRAAGFVGCSPYLVGRALTFGAPRAVTAAGWAPFPRAPEETARVRARVRAELGLPEGTIVVGIAGSIAWAPRRRYCYGLELVRALERVRRPDVVALIVGDGDGRERLERLARPLGDRVRFTGRVSRERVADLVSAFDLGSLPQSTDLVGSMRYTTKLAEYLAAGVPVVTGEVPVAYDLGGGWLERLPGDAPWEERYVAALAKLLDEVRPEDLAARRALVPRALPEFDRGLQQERVTAFLREILAARGRA